jgi:hypothetical protein
MVHEAQVELEAMIAEHANVPEKAGRIPARSHEKTPRRADPPGRAKTRIAVGIIGAGRRSGIPAHPGLPGQQRTRHGRAYLRAAETTLG